MTPEVCYQPNGSLIVGVETADEKTSIIFWEKIGLRHGEFQASIGGRSIKNLAFSRDSQILSFYECETRHLYFYVRSNYHWYQKYAIPVEAGFQAYAWGEKHDVFILNSNGL